MSPLGKSSPQPMAGSQRPASLTLQVVPETLNRVNMFRTLGRLLDFAS